MLPLLRVHGRSELPSSLWAIPAQPPFGLLTDLDGRELASASCLGFDPVLDIQKAPLYALLLC